jgi:putative membrane protein
MRQTAQERHAACCGAGMKPLRVLAGLALAVAFPLTALAQISDADAGAMKKLAWHNLAEIEAGKLAASKAENPRVKEYGQRMVEDHGRMLEELRRIATTRGVQLPDKPGMREHAEMLKLRTASGGDFDRRFLAQMVRAHEKDVQETADIAGKAQDAEFKAAVEQANAKIKEHLKTAQDLAGSAASGATR